MSIFLTGATGFVGRHLLASPDLARHGPVVAVVRREHSVAAESASPTGPRWVTADLHDPETYREALRGCDTVVHLAARTGPGTSAEHDRTNCEATRRLIEEAKAAGVRRFLFVSTIAVTYPEKRAYPYARAKERAEAAVRASGLDWAILRPTIIFGPGSPVGEGLRGLATAPILPLFGGGRARIHPVHVDDVVAAVVALLAEENWEGEIHDFGGREDLPFGEFLRRLRRAMRGSRGPALPLPVSPLISLLSVLERLPLPALPVTAGQFYAFRHDGVAASTRLSPAREERRGVREILEEMLSGAERGYRPIESPFPPPGGAGAGVGAEDDAHGPDAARLEAECVSMTRYLIGTEPSEYVRSKYREAHRNVLAGPTHRDSSFDGTLVAFARRGPLAVRLADTWAAVFSRSGPLRRKLVLLLAILESDGRTASRVDTPEPGGAVGFALRSALRGIGFAVSLLLAVLLFEPWRRLRRGDGGGEGGK
jgi:NADH dehydrogenase